MKNKTLLKTIYKSFSTQQAKQSSSIAQRFHEVYLQELDKFEKNTYIIINIVILL